jgi:hypothetical protein
MEHPAGQISAQRALSVYSAAEARFSASKYSASVGDALTHPQSAVLLLLIYIIKLKSK